MKESWVMSHLKTFYDKKEKLSHFWIGPFWVAIGLIHPDGLKNIMKGNSIELSFIHACDYYYCEYGSIQI